MTLPRSLLDAYAAHVADENAQAARSLNDARTTDNPAIRHELMDAHHDAKTRSNVWQQAHDLAAPHAGFDARPGHVPGRVRYGSPGDNEPGEGDE